MTEDDQECPHSRDGHGHCQHWWDGEEPCCWCGDDTPGYGPDDDDATVEAPR